MFHHISLVLIIVLQCSLAENFSPSIMTKEERAELRDEARKMFYHGYRAYMDNAYPADELMPLSCKGRFRGITPSRGDMDDALGNFSLTLVDSLDTLAVLGDFAEFSHAIKLVIRDVSFDQDVTVSVFETNIRMLGGLLSAHVLANSVKPDIPTLHWYNGELLKLAEDLGQRLLPAFNTSTGLPHGRINLRHGLKNIKDSRETCTACAGTMILEMAALSRLSGNPIYEKKAHGAMDALWNIRHRTSDLMGTVLNIHSGDWIRKDSGIGAGIDSYYEYCLKAYVLLGDDRYLTRFNRHYNAIMKYISRGPLMLDVLMHRPHLQSKNFMDALLAFWPGLQVMLGDVKPAVETHEMLYQVMQKHTLLPEAFTSDFQVHWGQHPIRPEFLESTYFLHRATGDDHYLHVGKTVLKALQQHARVPCGYAAVNDVRTRLHEDRMDSFVLAETFKYLYMLFENDASLPIDLNEYVMTTEAHFLPLSIANVLNRTLDETLIDDLDEKVQMNTCPNTASIMTEAVRRPLREMVGSRHNLAKFFEPADPRQVSALADMGITVLTLQDGRIQLLYATNTAKSMQDAAEGLSFMHEMSSWLDTSGQDILANPPGVKYSDQVLPAGPAHFGVELKGKRTYTGSIAKAEPYEACSPIKNAGEVAGKIALVLRGQCPFIDKARHLRKAGAISVIVVDNIPETSHKDTKIFAMSGDGKNDVDLPVVFLFTREADILLKALENDPSLEVTLGNLDSLQGNNEKTCSLTDESVKPMPPSIKKKDDSIFSIDRRKITTMDENIKRALKEQTNKEKNKIVEEINRISEELIRRYSSPESENEADKEVDLS